MTKEVTLKHIGYKVLGLAKIKDWYGNIGFIKMDKIDFDKLPTEEDIKKQWNDGGFGCQEIIGCYVDVYEVYEGDYCTFVSDMLIGEFTDKDVEVVTHD